MNFDEYELYSRIKSNIERCIVEGYESFAIAPFGRNGLLAKQILNWQYGINEEYIVDTYISSFNEKIITLDEFKNQVDEEKIAIIITATEKSIVDYFSSEFKKMNSQMQILSIYDYTRYKFVKGEATNIQTIRNIIGIKGVNGPNKFERFGKNHDGGYIIYNDIDKDTRAYSFGISNDVSWEKHFIQYGKDAQMYDHTIKGLPEENALFNWHKIGIAGEDKPEERLMSMVSILDENDDIENKNLILKMDVEGAEWDFINNTSSDILDNFKQIVFELHDLNPSIVVCSNPIINALKKLNLTHQAVWVHGNNYGPAYVDGDEILPQALEITYLNRRLYNFTDIHTPFPWSIDQNNDKDLEDFKLLRW